MRLLVCCALVVLLASGMEAGNLRVLLKNGRVPDKDSWPRGDSDAYVLFRLSPQDSDWRFTSREDTDTLNPTWNQWFDFGAGVSPSNTVLFEVRDYDSGILGLFAGSDFLGSGSFVVGSTSRDITVTFGGSYFINFYIEFTPLNLCATNNGGCGTNSICTFTGDNARTCTCVSGYTSANGANCNPINNCNSNNGGCGANSNCVYTGPGTNTCNCRIGFSSPDGRNCNPINNCATNNGGCGSNSVCTYTGPGTSTCSCANGYSSPTQRDCTPINPCNTNNGGCGSNSACVYVGPGVSNCVCVAGHSSSDGTNCQPINPCTQTPGICGTNSDCAMTGPNQYSCTCRSGFESATGANCVAINHCVKTPNICGFNSRCTYLSPGQYSCTCNSGFNSTNGANCEPINNCRTNNGGCGANSICTYTGPGANTCTCLAGFESQTRDGRNCNPINLCRNFPNFCGSNSVCGYTGPNTAVCACRTGFESLEGTGANCTAIDVCMKTPQICGDNSVCASTGPGTYNCTCLTNYKSPKGDGSSCVPINPCESDNGSCGNFSICTFVTANQRSCKCIAGYFGALDGTECKPFSTCAPGSYETAEPTATTDRVCSQCEGGFQCVGGDARPEACGSPNRYARPGLATCITAVDGFFTIGGNETTRISVQECPVGSRCSGGIQTPCVNGVTFQTLRRQATCNPCRTCVPGETLTRPCNPSLNAVCQDLTAPVLTLNGSVDITLEAVTDAWVEPGYTAIDSKDGDISDRVFVSQAPNTKIPGTYIITYTVADAANNTATASRTVTVRDTTAPIITLFGDKIIDIEAGTQQYDDDGASAYDLVDGIVDVQVAGLDEMRKAAPFKIITSYTVTYTARDKAGNQAVPVTRTINIVDTKEPVITLNGEPMVFIEASRTPVAYVDAGATADDIVDGDLTSKIVVTIQRDGAVNVSAVDNTVLGTYVISYDVTSKDGKQKARTVTRTVVVRDTTPPVITVTGPTSMTVEAATPYEELGATATDTYDSNDTVTQTIVIGGNTVKTFSPDRTVFTVTYNTKDLSGNAAVEATRQVTIRDTTPPVISLNGSASTFWEAGSRYVDAGAVAVDTLDGIVDVRTDNRVDGFVPAVYKITFDARDKAGNNATRVFRTVTVRDTTPPVITVNTVNGTVDLVVEAATYFADVGASAVDSFDGVVNVTTSGEVNLYPPSTPAVYELVYSAVDKAGNQAVNKSRKVKVIDTTPPVITLTGRSTTTHEGGLPYSEPGFSAFDTLDLNVTARVVVRIFVSYPIKEDVDNQVVNGEFTPFDGSQIDVFAPAGTVYKITYNVNDSALNAAIEGQRYVTIIDTTPPSFTFTLPVIGKLEAAKPNRKYSELGVVIKDRLEGDLTKNVVILVEEILPPDANRRRRSGAPQPRKGGFDIINTAAPLGTSYIITYTISDKSGNSASANRTLLLLDTQPPAITLRAMPGATPNSVQPDPKNVILYKGGIYAEPGASAVDAYDGDVTTRIEIIKPELDTKVINKVYEIVYTCSDSSNNTVSVTRTLRIVSKGEFGLSTGPSATKQASIGIPIAIVAVLAFIMIVVFIVKRRKGSKAAIISESAYSFTNPIFTNVPQAETWYHGRIPREEAERRIKINGATDGLFLVRLRSDDNADSFAITVSHHGKVAHYLLEMQPDGSFMLQNRECEKPWGTDVHSIITHLQTNQEHLATRLIRPCPIPVQADSVLYTPSKENPYDSVKGPNGRAMYSSLDDPELDGGWRVNPLFETDAIYDELAEQNTSFYSVLLSRPEEVSGDIPLYAKLSRDGRGAYVPLDRSTPLPKIPIYYRVNRNGQVAKDVSISNPLYDIAERAANSTRPKNLGIYVQVHGAAGKNAFAPVMPQYDFPDAYVLRVKRAADGGIYQDFVPLKEFDPLHDTYMAVGGRVVSYANVSSDGLGEYADINVVMYDNPRRGNGEYFDVSGARHYDNPKQGGNTGDYDDVPAANTGSNYFDVSTGRNAANADYSEPNRGDSEGLYFDVSGGQGGVRYANPNRGDSEGLYFDVSGGQGPSLYGNPNLAKKGGDYSEPNRGDSEGLYFDVSSGRPTTKGTGDYEDVTPASNVDYANPKKGGSDGDYFVVKPNNSASQYAALDESSETDNYFVVQPNNGSSKAKHDGEYLMTEGVRSDKTRGAPTTNPTYDQPRVAKKGAAKEVDIFTVKEDLNQPWYHGQISRQEAEARITSAGGQVGMYVVRCKDEKSGAFALTVSTGPHKFVHNLIERQPDGTYCVDKKPLAVASLQEVITMSPRAKTPVAAPRVQTISFEEPEFSGFVSRKVDFGFGGQDEEETEYDA